MIATQPRLTTVGDLLIEDAQGEDHAYRLTAAPAGLDAWACTVERAAEVDHGPYRVAVSPGGSWRCTCDAWKYARRNGPRGCKHTRHIAPLYALMLRLMPQEERS